MRINVCFVLILSILFLTDCRPPEEKNQTSSTAALRVAVDSNSMIECDNLLDTTKNIFHPITEKCLLNLVQNYLKLKKSHVYGGYIPFEKLDSSATDSSGLMLYLCYNDTTPFIAYKKVWQNRLNVDSTLADTAILKRSTTYSILNRDETTMNNLFLDITNIQSTLPVADTTNGRDVKEYQKSFYNVFGTTGMTTYGYFKRDELVTMMNQPGVTFCGLYYFFGYNPQIPERIRICLILVDKNGRLYMRDEAGNSVVYMDHMFPPPSL